MIFLNKYQNMLVWLQWGFDVMIGLFEQVRMRTNMAKTVAVLCRTGTINAQQSDAAYGQRMTGKGYQNHVRKSRTVMCGKCGEYLDVASMNAHLHTQNDWSGRARTAPPSLPPPPTPPSVIQGGFTTDFHIHSLTD